VGAVHGLNGTVTYGLAQIAFERLDNAPYNEDLHAGYAFASHWTNHLDSSQRCQDRLLSRDRGSAPAVGTALVFCRTLPAGNDCRPGLGHRKAGGASLDTVLSL
jgi:hypothetical protein